LSEGPIVEALRATAGGVGHLFVRAEALAFPDVVVASEAMPGREPSEFGVWHCLESRSAGQPSMTLLRDPRRCQTPSAAARRAAIRIAPRCV